MAALLKVREVRAQMKEIMENQKINLISAGTDWDVIRNGNIVTEFNWPPTVPSFKVVIFANFEIHKFFGKIFKNVINQSIAVSVSKAIT